MKLIRHKLREVSNLIALVVKTIIEVVVIIIYIYIFKQMWHVFGWTFRGCASGCGTTTTTSKFLGVVFLVVA